MMSKHIVVDVDNLETHWEKVNELGSGPFGPPPPSSKPKRKFDQSTHESEVQGEFDTGISETQSKKSKKKTSDVWLFFENQGVGSDGKPRAKCKGCGKAYVVVAGGSKYGTSTLSRHMGRCLGVKAMRQQNISEMIIDHQGKLKGKKIDQKVFRELVAMSIINHDLPFSYAEYDGVRTVWKYLNHEVKCISRLTAAHDVWKIYLKNKAKLKEQLALIHGRICLTCDLWTACSNEGYLCLTAHYVDLDWKLTCKILAFCDMPPPHSGLELAKKVMEIMNDWGIEKKIFSMTLDNASSNDSVQLNVKEQLYLQENLLCDGEFFHIRCCAHILNLIVQEGLKVASIANERIRESIKYVKSSEARMMSFEECVQKTKSGTNAYLVLDVPTRWNSTYLMLESALKYKRAFAMLALNDRNYKCCPSNEEWKRGEQICEFLMPFYDITKLISSISYPTANLYFAQVWKIELLLLNHLNGEDGVLKEMAFHMKKKFDKYWGEYNVLLAMAVILDPRVKFTMLKRSYVKVDPNGFQERLNVVKDKLFMLYEEYAKNSSSSLHTQFQQSQISLSSSIPSSSNTNADVWISLADDDEDDAISSSKSQLETYLEMPKLDFSLHKDLDVLKWWKDHSLRFPILANMASDLMSIPITTMASDSAFSIGGRVLNKYRSRLLPRKVQALICTRSWLHGFTASGWEDEEEDENDSVKDSNDPCSDDREEEVGEIN